MMTSTDLMRIQMETAMLRELMGTVSGNKTSASGETGNAAGGLSFGALFEDALTAAGVSSAQGVEGSAVSGGASSGSVSPQMLAFIENHEGFSAAPYRGVDSWNETVGYGHVVTAGENYDNTALTQTQAEALLKSDLVPCEESVRREFAGTPLSQNQFDALVSFSYNLGTNIWEKTPKLVSDIKSGAPADALRQDFLACSHVGDSQVQGLVTRRLDEWQVFCGGTYPVLA